MGMYTEIFFRAEVDEEVVNVVSAFRDGRSIEWPEHEFFAAPRFRSVATCSSYYFPQANHLVIEHHPHVKAYYVSFRANLKNYDDEIEKFFDWVSPHVIGEPGTFIGYSMYEQDEVPTLQFKAPLEGTEPTA